VPRPVILDFCRRRPELALGVITVLAQRVRAFAAVIEDIALRNVTARLARLLLTEARLGRERRRPVGNLRRGRSPARHRARP
jgi:hypothetical protein